MRQKLSLQATSMLPTLTPLPFHCNGFGRMLQSKIFVSISYIGVFLTLGIGENSKFICRLQDHENKLHSSNRIFLASLLQQLEITVII